MSDRTRLLSPPARWEDYFEPGERLLWQGAPLPGLRIRPMMVLLSVLGLAFFGAGLLFVVVGVRQALTGGPGYTSALGLFAVILGLPFALVGPALLVGPWYAAQQAHRKIRYALSTRRAYVATSWWRHILETYPIEPGDVIELEHGRADTVWFKTTHGRDSEGSPTLDRAGFRDIADGQAVYAMLRNIQKGGA